MSTWRKWKNQQGASAVEFAVILPVLALILFGIVELSVLLYNKQVITNASREGARAGIVAPQPRVTPAAIETVVNHYCSTHLITFSASPVTASTTVTGYASGATWGTDLTVNVAYPYTFLYLSSLGFGPMDVTAQTTMRYE